MTESKNVIVVGAGIFGLSLAVALREKGHSVTVFDKQVYHETGYQPPENDEFQAASVDHNKIFRASYGSKLHYQRLAYESRDEWLRINKDAGSDLFVDSGMLRVQPTSELGALEKETLANMERDGLRPSQFIKSDAADRERARAEGWEAKLLEFPIPDDPQQKSFEAVLDSSAGFMRCSAACEYYRKLALSKGVNFKFGPKEGEYGSIVSTESTTSPGKKRATGIKTKDGLTHSADVVVIAAGSYTTQLLPDMAYHLESSAGSIATFKIDESNIALWDKYSPEKFPVITWKSTPRNKAGKDTGSVYVLPRTPEGLVKIGYRGIKFTNFQPAPEDASFNQDGKWSIPLSPKDSTKIPEPAVDAIRQFVSIFLPDFTNTEFYSSKLCWYTDTLDNSFVIDWVPTYADNSVFVTTGGSGHGAKFLPVLGKHAADIFDNKENNTSAMYPFWRWREDANRGNGLSEGPNGPRNFDNLE